jgi:hypothetical protein
MLYKYSFGPNGINVSKNNGVPELIPELIKINGTSTVDNTVINTLYTDPNILSIIYYDTIYYIKILVNDVEFKFEDVPWDFTLKKSINVPDQIIIKDSEFNKSITISTDNVKFLNCEFSISDYNSLDPGSSLILYNVGLINLNLTDCVFNYDNDALPIDGVALNTITTLNSTIKINPIVNLTPSDPSTLELINIYNIFYLSDKFTLELNPDTDDTPFRFSDIGKKLHFKLLGDVIIENTYFTRQCTFNLNGSDLTFSGCSFDNNIEDAYICQTFNNDFKKSNINFIKLDNNYNTIYPRKSQIKENKLWNWSNTISIDGNIIESDNTISIDGNSLSIDGNIIPSYDGNYKIDPSIENNFVKINLDIPSSLTWLNDLYYFNLCYFEIGSTGSYKFGTGISSNKLNQELNLLIPGDIDEGNNGNDLILTVISNASLNIINNDSNTNIILHPLTDITASEGKHCINIGGNSVNKNVDIVGNFTNNMNTFIDQNIIATIIGNINLNIVSDYDMTNENNVIIGTNNYSSGNNIYLNTYINGDNVIGNNINGNGINLIVGNTTGNQDGKNYNFMIDNISSLGNLTSINIPCIFTMNNDFTLRGVLNEDCTFVTNNASPINLTFNNLTVHKLPLIDIDGNLNINDNSIINPVFNIININNLDITNSTFYNNLFINESTNNPTIFGNVNITTSTFGNNNINCKSTIFNLDNLTLSGNLNLNSTTDYSNIIGNTTILKSTLNGINNCKSELFSIIDSNFSGNNTFTSQQLSIGNSTFTGNNINISDYNTSGNTSNLVLTISGNSSFNGNIIPGNTTFNGNSSFNVKSFNIEKTTLSGRSQITVDTTSLLSDTNLITNSSINDLHYININNGNLTISNSKIDYITNEPTITLSSGVFSMGNSTITKNINNVSANIFNLSICSNSDAHTIENSQLNCFNKFNIVGGNLNINKTKFKDNSYILSGGNINVNNSYLNSLNSSLTSIDILTGSLQNIYAVNLINSVIDIDQNKALVYSYDNNANYVAIKECTINLSHTNIDMSVLTLTKSWFETSNIINFDTGTISISNNPVNGKDFSISSNQNISLTSTSDIVKSIINIRGVKKNKSIISPVYQNSVDIDIVSITTTAIITFKDFSMNGLTYGVNPKYYIKYETAKNINCNIKVNLDDINFLLAPNVYSVSPDLISKLDSIIDYKLGVNVNGNYFIGNDELVKLNTATFQNIYLYNASLTNVNLSGINANSLLNKRLVFNIESTGIPAIFSLAVKTHGLDIIDNRLNQNNSDIINLENSQIDVSSVSGNVSALNLQINTTLSNIIIGNSTFTTKSAQSTDISFINLIKSTSTINTTSNRIVEINSNNTWVGKAIYFIKNNDNTLLKVNSSPLSNQISKNLIYWPYLNNMSTEVPRISDPLTGNSITFAESWVTNEFVTITNTLNSDGNIGGLSGSWNDLTNNNNKYLKFVQAYSSSAFTNTVDNFNFSLNKNYYNNSTCHTGKFNNTGNLSDTYDISDTVADGLISTNIIFNNNELVLMPALNEVKLTLNVTYSNSNFDTFINDVKIYEIVNGNTITQGNNVQSIQEYLNNNFIISNSSYDGNNNALFTINGNNNYSIYMNDSLFTFYNDFENLSAYNEQNALFNIRPITDNTFYFLNSVNINLSDTTIPINFDPLSPIIYPGIDNISSLGSSNLVNIKLNKTAYAWGNTLINVDLDSYPLYHNVTNGIDPSLSITINNRMDNDEIYGLKLGANNSGNFIYDVDQQIAGNSATTITRSLVFNNTNFTAISQNISSNGIDNRYEWNEAAFGLLIPAASVSGNTLLPFVPTATDITLNSLLIDNNVSGNEHVFITFDRYNINGNTYQIAGNNVINTNETDQLIRYKMNIIVENVQEKNLDQDYEITFNINNNSGDVNPLRVRINYFKIPFIARITKSFENINRDTLFNINIQLSGKLNGKVLLAFQDTGTNTKDSLNNNYVYTDVINNAIKYQNNSTFESYTYLISMDSQNSKTLTYKFTPTINNIGYKISDITMNIIVDKITNNSDQPYTLLPSNLYNISNVQYLETLKNIIGITINKLINSNEFEMLNNFDFSDTLASNKLILEEHDNYLIPTSFNKKIGNVSGNIMTVVSDNMTGYISGNTTGYISGNTINYIPGNTISYFSGNTISYLSGDTISSNNLTPINKFTRYYITMNTTVLGLSIAGNTITSGSSEYIESMFTFTDGNGNSVYDVEVIKMNGNNIVTTSRITLNNLNFQNNYNGVSYVNPGNDVLIFRRKPGSTEVYDSLKIYYDFIIPNSLYSNYQNLPPGPQLLTTISYSATSVLFTDTSAINIGNFRLFPSGDGKYLILSDSTSDIDKSIPNYSDSDTIDGKLLKL